MKVNEIPASVSAVVALIATAGALCDSARSVSRGAYISVVINIATNDRKISDKQNIGQAI